jgi:hypothetical protein
MYYGTALLLPLAPPVLAETDNNVDVLTDNAQPLDLPAEAAVRAARRRRAERRGTLADAGS